MKDEAQPVVFVGGPMHGISRMLEPKTTRWECFARTGGTVDNRHDPKVEEHIYRKSDATLMGFQIWYDATVPVAKLLDDMVGVATLYIRGDE